MGICYKIVIYDLPDIKAKHHYFMKCFFLPLLLFCQFAFSQNIDLRSQLTNILAGKNATVGIAIQNLDSGDTLSINGNRRFPMQSVYKLHLGIYAMYLVDKGKLSLDQNFTMRRSELDMKTWSPMRDNSESEEIKVTLHQLIEFAVASSDNIACDLLFKACGGPSKVNAFFRKMGVKGLSIKSTEKEMHANPMLQFKNYSTPKAAVWLLAWLRKQNVLSERSYDLIWEILKSTWTGPGRLKKGLPKEVELGHKTGSSGKDSNGVTHASNDIGIFKLPNGQYVAIAVFVSKSTESEQVNDGIIAEVCRAVYEGF